ncbi:MAG: hypothetical protein ACTSUN_06700 [Promethearchaeota archaeon]
MIKPSIDVSEKAVPNIIINPTSVNIEYEARGSENKMDGKINHMTPAKLVAPMIYGFLLPNFPISTLLEISPNMSLRTKGIMMIEPIEAIATVSTTPNKFKM